MSTAAVRGVVRQLGLDADAPTDAALLTRYARHRDEAAFAELLRRHGPVVLGVCRRVLADSHAAEDAFQAVFLVLARKADSVRPPGLVGNWLYGVAVRTANKAKVAAARRWRREMTRAMASRVSDDPGSPADLADLRAVIDDELGRLPESLRAPVVLCDLGGKTRAEAARELGCPEGTIAARLHRARQRLADRLTRRGVTLPAAGVGAILCPAAATAAVSPDLACATLAAARVFAAGVASPAVPPAVQTLAEGTLRTMTTGKLKLSILALLAAGLVVGAGAVWAASGDRQPGPEDPMEAAAPPEPEKPTALPAPPAPPGYVSDIQFSPDGKLYAIVAGGKVGVYDAVTGKKRWETPGEAARFEADPGGRDIPIGVRDGKVETFTTPPTVALWVMGPNGVSVHTAMDGMTDPKSKVGPRPKTNLGWHFVSFSPDGKRYAAHFGSGVRVYDTATGFEPVRLDNQHEPGGGAIAGSGDQQLAWSPDGKQLAAIGLLVKPDVMGAVVWEAESGTRRYPFEDTLTDSPRAITFTPDGKSVAVGYKDHVAVWTGRVSERTGIFTAGSTRLPTAGQVTSLSYSKDGKLLAVGVRKPIPNGADRKPNVVGYKTEVQLLDAADGTELRRFDGFEGVNHNAPTKLPVTAIAFSPDGAALLAGTGLPPIAPLPNDLPKAGELKVFRTATPAPPAGPWKEQKVLNHTGWLVGSVAYSPDGKVVVVGGTDGHVRAYTTDTLKQLWDYKGEGGKFAAVAFAPDGKTVAATYKDGVRFLDAATGKAGDVLEEKGSEPIAVAYFPDRQVAEEHVVRQVIFGNARDYFVKSWLKWPQVGGVNLNSIAAGKEPADHYAVPIAVAPDGKRVAVTGPPHRDTGKNVFWAWSAGSGAGNELIEGHKAAVTAAAWSRDGKVLVSGDADGVVIVRGVEVGLNRMAGGPTTVRFQERSRLSLGGRVAAVAISPDGEHVAAATTRPTSAEGVGAYAEEVFVWNAANAPKKVEPISSHEAGGPFAGVASVAFAPDGKTLVSGFCNFTHLTRLGELTGKVRVFTLAPAEPKPEPAAALAGWKEKATLTHHAGPVDSVAFAPDGKAFVSGGADGKVLLWDSATLKPQELGAVVPAGKFTAVAYSPDGKLVAATRDKVTGFFNPATRQVVLMNPPFLGGRGVAFSPDGKWVGTSSGYTSGFRSLGNGGEAYGSSPGELPAGAAAPVAWSPDSLYLAHILPSADPNHDWRIGIMGVTPDTKPKNLEGHKGQVLALAWSPDGKTLASGGNDGNVILWDAETGKIRSQTKISGRNGASTIRSVAFAPDGKVVAAGAELDAGKSPYRVVLIDAANGKEAQHLMTMGSPIRSLAFSPDGNRLLIACGIDRTQLKPQMTPKEMEAAGAVEVWERGAGGDPPAAPPEPAAQWQERKTLDLPGVLVNAVAFTPSGKSIAFCGNNDTVELRDAVTLQQRTLFKIKEAEGAVYGITFKPQGWMVAVTNRNSFSARGIAEDGIANIPDSPTWAGQFSAIAYSPDGKLLAVCDGFAVKVVDAATRKEVAAFGKESRADPPVAPTGLAWSPDGKRIAAIRNERADEKWAVSVIDVPKGEVRDIFAHTQPVTALVWSADGKTIVTGGADGNVTVWDAETLREVRRMPVTVKEGTTGRVFSVAISPDGKTIASGVEWQFAVVDELVPPTQEVILWDTNGQQVARFTGKGNAQFASVAFSPDGTALAAGRGRPIWEKPAVGPKDGAVVVWDRKPQR